MVIANQVSANTDQVESTAATEQQAIDQHNLHVESLQAAAPGTENRREADMKQLLNGGDVQRELDYYRRTVGTPVADAAVKIMELYLARAGELDKKPFDIKEVAAVLKEFKFNQDGKEYQLNDAGKAKAAEIASMELGTIKGLVLDRGLDQQYPFVEMIDPGGKMKIKVPGGK